MQFARVRLINYSKAEGKPPEWNCQGKGSCQSDSKREHPSKHNASPFSKISVPSTCDPESPPPGVCP